MYQEWFKKYEGVYGMDADIENFIERKGRFDKI